MSFDVRDCLIDPDGVGWNALRERGSRSLDRANA
jgi:hypothetical protein